MSIDETMVALPVVATVLLVLFVIQRWTRWNSPKSTETHVWKNRFATAAVGNLGREA